MLINDIFLLNELFSKTYRGLIEKTYDIEYVARTIQKYRGYFQISFTDSIEILETLGLFKNINYNQQTAKI